ncbi:MAG: glycosyltransferase family 39 protein [Candidatus Omnitrophica bacterium]|nr:glycosyltransferase family 39 protein [Candidatus Omnitrophota bacterium]
MNLIGAIRLILGLTVTTAVGWLFVKIISLGEKRPFLEEKALGYGLGIAILSLSFIDFWFLGLKPTFIYILLPWIVVFILLIITKRITLFRTQATRYDAEGPITFLEKFLLFGISVEVIHSFFKALVKPIEAFDSVAMYAIRAKVFFEAGGIPADFFKTITKAFPNSGHPPMIPLAEAWIYTIMGGLNDLLVKIIFPLFFVSLIIIFYFALRGFLNRKAALIFTFILATIPQLNHYASIGYADFALTFYFTAGFIYLFKWMRGKIKSDLFISAISLAFACWVKLEGWALFLCCALIFILFIMLEFRKREGFIRLITFLLIVLILASPWLFIVKSAGLENEVYKFESIGANRFISSFTNLDRLPRILYEFQKQFFGPKKWNIVWIIFMALFILNIKTVFRGELKYPTLLLILVIAAYGYSYLLIPLKPGEPINWNVGSTLSRLFIHFTPLAVYWIACVCHKKGYLEN